MANHDNHKPGRPPRFNNCLDLQAMCEFYFETCDAGEEVEKWSSKKGELVKFKRPIPYTKPGLAYFLGFESRHSLKDLIRKPEFSPTLKRAFTKIEDQKLRRMLVGEYNFNAGSFDLRNNSDYSEKTETEVSQKLSLEDVLQLIASVDPALSNTLRQRLGALAGNQASLN